MSEPSIFSQIISGEIPCHKVYEDDKTLAFLDIFPTVEGHTLVIPKSEVEFIWDLPEDDYKQLMLVAQKVGTHLRDVLGVAYVGVKVMGTDVPHAHVHLIPFATPEQYKSFAPLNTEPDHAALAELAKKLAF